MTEKGVGKPWTTHEDNLLIQAVAIHGENDNWKAVANSVPGRTNKACRKRWLHSLSPNVKKSAWTAEEDQLLLSLFAANGTKWSVIARQIPGRTDDACSKRYREALDPSLKRDDWTSDEDAKLQEAYARLGGKWGLIGQELNRSGLGCRNRWRMLERRKIRSEPSSGAPGASTLQSASTHAQDSPYWDGRSPQYVAPAVLYQGSPLHSQEARPPSYSPQQILSGAHLNGSPPDTRETPSVQFSTSAAAHTDGVTAHTDPQILHSRSFSPEHISSELNLPPTNPGSQSYDFDYIPIDNDHDANSAEPDGPAVDGLSRAGGSASAASVVEPDGVNSSDSPAPPSHATLASLPGSPIPQTSSVSGATTTNPAPAPGRSYYRTAEEKARDRALEPIKRTVIRSVRLSSKLPATSDSTVLAYACGHRDCWPEGVPRSTNAFVTSGGLSEHSRLVHRGDLGGSKPFRCGLEGCEKSWKSLNGLQYHLQVSKYHFQQALSQVPLEDVLDEVALTPPEINANESAPSASPSEDLPPAPPVPDIYKIKRKTFPCPHPGCPKEYKQVSGLRYHLTHGHEDELPTQLHVIPPALARKVKEKGSASRRLGHD